MWGSGRSGGIWALILSILCIAVPSLAEDLDEFKVKREAVFEFVQKPVVTRGGDRVEIRFETKGFCDVTVAIEDPSMGAGPARIVRHLACGVLGPKAPEPLQRNSTKQTLVWDGKDDKGEYIDDKDTITVRVSLGLKPQFERTLFWSPHKRISEGAPLICAPLKGGYHQAGFLTSGSNNNPVSHVEGRAAFAMAVRGERIALAMLKLNRLATDSSTGGLPLEGPETFLRVDLPAYGTRRPVPPVAPWSVELSPDGKRLYLAGYAWTFWETPKWDCLSGVRVMDYEKNDPSRVFAGTLKPYEFGTGDGQFHCATSAACDAKGRVYVSDYVNDRIQVFTPEGRFLRSVRVAKPAVVRVHRKTGEIFVFSWPVHNAQMTVAETWRKVTPSLTRLGPLENPIKVAHYPLPLPVLGNCWTKHPPGPLYWGELDSWTDPVTVWISTVRGAAVERGMGGGGDGFGNYGTWARAGVKAFALQNGTLVPRADFGKQAVAEAVRAVPPIIGRQRLYVNPVTGIVYIGEGDCGVMKAFNQLVEIDPKTGKVRLVDLPLGSEDLCFDVNGLAYLRTDTVVARYDPRTWREIPWDYGEERVKHAYGMRAQDADLAAALITSGHRSFNFWHLGGIDISPTGHIVVTTCNGTGLASSPDMVPNNAPATGGAVRKNVFRRPRGYAPTAYPGRMRWGEIHIWDERGRKIYEDAVPGMGHLNGIGIDRNDNIYMLLASRRLIDGKPIDPGLERDVSGTLATVAARKAKVLSSSGRGVPIPLPDDAKPKRPPDVTGYTTGWIEGAEWFYGGVGFATPGKCVCWNSRFDLDYFNRSFAPEPLSFSVAVLDSSGNLILRIGNYGNVGDGVPLVKQGGPVAPRSIGGDEVALMHACYVATHTDHRLFIADAGNARIVSVKLDYYAAERVALKDVKDGR